ncbi:MAG TPA: class I SAM-dependent methyltransferase [Thermodesulfobacteriota bacterium]|nr:class I SAM-dependent methyltransferase [Thermodesulfobacteriota bacterium]
MIITQEKPAEYFEHSRPEIAALIPSGCRTLIDVGCAGGALGALLKTQHPNLEVRGIEPVADQAEKARALLDDVLIGNADAPLPENWPRPDCIVLADVIEHLIDPWETLRLWQKRLTTGGWLILSVPNVGHKSIISGLIRGTWDYAPEGILDRTHLRFFTRRSLMDLLNQTGFRLIRLERIKSRGLSSKIVQILESPWTDHRQPKWISFLGDLVAYQFLVAAQRDE